MVNDNIRSIEAIASHGKKTEIERGRERVCEFGSIRELRYALVMDIGRDNRDTECVNVSVLSEIE